MFKEPCTCHSTWQAVMWHEAEAKASVDFLETDGKHRQSAQQKIKKSNTDVQCGFEQVCFVSVSALAVVHSLFASHNLSAGHGHSKQHATKHPNSSLSSPVVYTKFVRDRGQTERGAPGRTTVALLQPCVLQNICLLLKTFNQDYDHWVLHHERHENVDHALISEQMKYTNTLQITFHWFIWRQGCVLNKGTKGTLATQSMNGSILLVQKGNCSIPLVQANAGTELEKLHFELWVLLFPICSSSMIRTGWLG